MAISRLIYLFGDKTIKEEVPREAYESHFIGYPRSIKMYKNLKKNSISDLIWKEK